MIKLQSLLGLQTQAQAEMRADMKLASMLPEVTSDAYLRATLMAHAPNVQLPAVLPEGGGALLSMMVKLAAVAPVFPITNPRMLLAYLQRAVASLAASVLPQAQFLPAVPMKNMAIAARVTLALRAQGLCPMALADVDARFAAQAGATDTQGRFSSAMGFAAALPRLNMPPLALPAPKLQLAWQMAVLAQAANAPAGLRLPALSDPSLTRALLNQLGALSTVPVPVMPVSLDELQAMAEQLQDLATIQEAFGPDAMTPAGVARVNAMLSYMASLRVPMPLPAQSLQVQLDALPKFDDVAQGTATASAGAMNIAASMSVPPPSVPILPLLEELAGLKQALTPGSLLPCARCNSEIGNIAASMAGTQLPPLPQLPQVPFLA
ncbi:hypothetical protein [Ruegeria hyattellae]|uniref:hypothetical protein n=1 Tax=Ruegeria hyattellae TaxID=3233337 RepID=UPI00355C42B9